MPCSGRTRFWAGHASHSRRSAPSCASTGSCSDKSGASLRPHPAQLDLRVGQVAAEHLRVRHRDRARGVAQLPGHPPRAVPAPFAQAGASGRRARLRDPLCEGPGKAPRPHAGRFALQSVVNVSAMSFGSLSGTCRRGAEPGGRPGRLLAEHRRGGPVGVPPQRRRPDLPDRDGLLQLPRQGRQLQPRLGSRRRSRGAPVRALEIKLSQGALPPLSGRGRFGFPVTPGRANLHIRLDGFPI